MPITNALLVRYRDGYKTGFAADFATYGRREGFLSIGDVSDVNAVNATITQVLAVQSQLQEAVTMGVEPSATDDTPYLGVWVGDYVTAPDASGTATSYRVVSITGTCDEEGFARFVPELRTRTDEVAERTRLWLKRIGDGTLAGRSQKATLIRPLDSKVPSGKAESVSPPGFSQFALSVAESEPYNVEDPFRLTQVDATLLTSGSTTTTVKVRKNSSDILTLTIGSGVTHVVEFPTTLSFVRGDKLTVKTTAVGTGATGLYVNLIGGPAY
jgi:hypothetical protein